MAINNEVLYLLGMANIGDSLPFSIAQTHPLYAKNKPIWEKMSDAYEGQETIKAKGQKYLPQMNGQTAQDYQNYKERASWGDYTSYVIKNYLGMLYRKAPQVFFGENVPDNEKPPVGYFNIMTAEGKSLAEFSQDVAEEILKNNRVGILIDFPKLQDIGNVLDLTQYDYEEKGIKPLLSSYDAFSIINWHWEYIDYKLVPMYFVLKETVYDGFDGGTMVASTSDIYRVLFLHPDGSSFKYKQIVFRERIEKDKTVSDVVDVIEPLMNGEPLNFIPFYIMDDKGINYKTIEKPMLNGLVDTNISYYRLNADWSNFLHMLGSPTLFFPGWDVKVYKQPRLGGALAGPKGCEPRMIQASADQSIRVELDKLIEQMSVFGLQRINGEGYIASVDTARVTSSSESSNLTILSKSMGRSFTSILQFLLKWGRYSSDEVSVEFNRDFFTDDISSADLLGWGKAYQQGIVSWDTFFFNLKKREVYSDNVDSETEKQRIQDSLQEQFDVSGQRYMELLDEIANMKEEIQATVTTSSSGQSLLSMSTASGAGISTSPEISEKSMETASARNNETPGKDNASAKEQTDQTKVDTNKDPNKKPNNDDSKVK